MKDLGKRIGVAVWGIPLILGLSFWGGYYFLTLIFAINLMALWEFYRMFENKEIFSFKISGAIIASGLLLSSWWLNFEQFSLAVLIAVLLLLMQHLKIDKGNPSLNTLVTVAGMVYITGLLVFTLKLRSQLGQFIEMPQTENTDGKFFILVWLSIWACDTFAYFGGSTFGKHKLAPKTSPNKTIEGGLSGLLGAILVFGGLGKLIIPGIGIIHLLSSGLIIGIFGQVGDLIESRFKRDAGVKDTSTLLPGHGGFLDRFDSFIFVSPFIYLYFMITALLK